MIILVLKFLLWEHYIIEHYQMKSKKMISLRKCSQFGQRDNYSQTFALFYFGFHFDMLTRWLESGDVGHWLQHQITLPFVEISGISGYDEK